MARPVCKGFQGLALVSLLERIRSRVLPGQDGDPRSLVLIITTVLADRSIKTVLADPSMLQVSMLSFDCQAIFPSTTRRQPGAPRACC